MAFAVAVAAIVPSLVACTPLEGLSDGGAPSGQTAAVDAAPAPAPAAVPAPAPAPVPVPAAALADPAVPSPAPSAAPKTADGTAAGETIPAAAEAPATVATPQGVLGAVPAGEGAGGNPLAGDTLYGPNFGAAEAAAQLQGSRPADAALLAQMANVPTATWLGSWNTDVTSAVRQRVAEAKASGGVPVLVAYNAPNLDCGGHSAAGGVSSAAAYDVWIRQVAAGIGTDEAVVVLEPDTLALLCGDGAERTRMLQAAVSVLEGNPGTHTYLDAGHSNWVGASVMAERLRAAGVADADGFALNVSNYEITANNVAYGSELSALLGGAHFIIDTSRNGNGPGSDWCNPSGRALGQPTTTQTGHPLVDAFVWIKTPGESDGACNGGPAAGQFWTDYALGLAGR